MREKKKLWIFVALTLLVGAVMAGVSPVSAQYPTEGDIYMDPASVVWTYPAHDIGDSFTVDLMVRNVTEFWSVVFSVHWDPLVLDWVEPAVQGDCLGTGADVSAMMIDTKDHTNGYIGGASYMDLAGVNYTYTAASPAWVATLNFTVVGYSSGTNINFTDTTTYPSGWGKGPAGPYEQDYDAMDPLYFELPPPPPYGPTVDFSWPAGTYYENDNVTFTATSTPGYHISTDFLPVMNYTWDFGDGTAPVVDDVSGTPGADSVVTHNFTAAATRTVTVTAETEDNPADTLETASKSKDILIWALVFSRLDVQTDKHWLGNTTKPRLRGEGPNLPGSAFAPGETVILQSDVLYEGIPVVDLNVGFQVNDPDGLLFTSLSANTNATGHARVSFRVPQAPLPKFGAYEVISTARVFETDYNDTLKFYVGWIVKIEAGIPATPDPVARTGTTEFNVTVTNYDPYDAYPMVLTVNAYDKLGQAIATNMLAYDIPAEGTGTPGTAGPSRTTVYQLSITVPGWAWPGTATVKANVYTDWPALGGTAYCPEVTDTFSIVS